MMHSAVRELLKNVEDSKKETELSNLRILNKKEIENIRKSATSHLCTYAGPNVKMNISALKIQILCEMLIDKLPRQLLLFK